MEYIGNLEKIEKYLPEGWERKAKELKAFQREGEIKTPGELLMLNLLHMTAGESLQGTSSMVRLTAGMTMKKEAKTAEAAKRRTKRKSRRCLAKNLALNCL